MHVQGALPRVAFVGAQAVRSPIGPQVGAEGQGRSAGPTAELPRFLPWAPVAVPLTDRSPMFRRQSERSWRFARPFCSGASEGQIVADRALARERAFGAAALVAVLAGCGGEPEYVGQAGRESALATLASPVVGATAQPGSDGAPGAAGGDGAGGDGGSASNSYEPAAFPSAPDTGSAGAPAGCATALAGPDRKGPAGPRAAGKKVLQDPKHPLHRLNLQLVYSRDDGSRVEFFGLESDRSSTFRVLFIVAKVEQKWTVLRQHVCAARAWPVDAPPFGPPGSSYPGTNDIRDSRGNEFGIEPKPNAIGL